MQDSIKIETAKDFIANHKKSIQEYHADNDDAQWLEVYNKLRCGVFGEYTDNTEYGEEDENGEYPLIKEATECEIEISRFDTKSGNPVIFRWENQE